MSAAPDFATWAAEHLRHADGLALELEPWQRALLNANPFRAVDVDAAQRRGRRRAAARGIAIALALGERVHVHVVSLDRAAAEELYGMAVDELERLGSALNLDTAPITTRIMRT